MTVTNENNLEKIGNDIHKLREYIIQTKSENMVYPNAGENITVSPTAQQTTDSITRCNDILTTIKADVLALETI